ncbi:hypothetical protein TWF730_006073 [Orbilia blumenaviensis]|uniref:Uncharacterized protein n=1 Tax=Orbilia blumenaviensis TaxID=1796055 RepID=A0AAV9VMB6_9PEZI
MTSTTDTRLAQPITSRILQGVVLFLTLPHHRFFIYNTLKPVQLIENHLLRQEEDSAQNRRRVSMLIANWRQRKKGELEFVSLAGIALTAIVTATLSWGVVEKSHWVGIAAFYASLMMAIVSLLMSAQQVTLLALLGEFPKDHTNIQQELIDRYLAQLLTKEILPDNTDNPELTPHDDSLYVGDQPNMRCRWRLSWQMTFVWQTASMFVAYSFLWYMIGLSVMICTPIRIGNWGDDVKIGIAYMATSAFAWGIFIPVSLLGYRKILFEKAVLPEEQGLYHSEDQGIYIDED